MPEPAKHIYTVDDLVLSDNINLWLETENGDEILAFATSANVEINADSIDCSNKLQPKWNITLQGKSSYTISSDALYTAVEGALSFDTIMEMMIKRAPVSWKMGFAKDVENGDYTLDLTKNNYSGKANITSASLNTNNNDVASCSISLTGAGAIEFTKGVPASSDGGGGGL